MNKNLTGDIGILLRVIEHQRDLARIMQSTGNMTAVSLAQNKDAIDLCSFHMLNMYEEYKNLTDDSKNALTFIDANVIRILRNVIGHTYQTALNQRQAIF